MCSRRPTRRNNIVLYDWRGTMNEGAKCMAIIIYLGFLRMQILLLYIPIRG